MEAGGAPFPLQTGGASVALPPSQVGGTGPAPFPLQTGGTSMVLHPLQTGGASAALPPPQSVEVFTPLASQVIGTASAVVPSPPQAGATSVLSPPITDPEVGTAKPTVPSPCVEEYLSPPRTRQGTLYNQRTSNGVASQYPLRQYPIGGVNEEGQPAGYYWAHSPFSTLDLLNWKNFNTSYRDDPQKVADLVASIFATHHPNWADVQALLNILLTADERRLVLNRANQEAQRLRDEDTQGILDPAEAIPRVDPKWDPNSRGGLASLKHYRRCILEGLRKGVPKQRSLNVIQTLQQKADEDPSEFLERIYQAYRKYTDADPEAPENVRMVNMTFIGQSAPDIRNKLQRVDGVLGMSPSQLVDIAFKVYNAREAGKAKRATVSLEMAQGSQKKQDPRAEKGNSLGARYHAGRKRGPKEKKKGPIGINQCAHCKEEGHWRNECPNRQRESTSKSPYQVTVKQKTEDDKE